MLTHSTSSSRSTDSFRAAIARFGASSNRRGGTRGGDCSSSSARSYWPSTRCESTPVNAPTCAPINSPDAERSGAASGPALLPILWLKPPSSGRIVRRFAAIQARGRPPRAVAVRRSAPARCTRSTRRANSCARGWTADARTPPGGGEPATRSPTRCARRQSITSTQQSVARRDQRSLRIVRAAPRRAHATIGVAPSTARLSAVSLDGACLANRTRARRRKRPWRARARACLRSTGAARRLGRPRSGRALRRRRARRRRRSRDRRRRRARGRVGSRRRRRRLPAPRRGARRARLGAPARRPARRRRRRSRARPPADRTAPSAPRASDPSRAATQARPRRRARRCERVAAGRARGARTDRALRRAAPQRVDGDGAQAARRVPLRADRAARHARALAARRAKMSPSSARASQRLRELAGEIARAEPRPSTRELARRLAAVVPEARSAIAAGNRDAPAHLSDAPSAQPDSPDAHLQAAFQQLREDVLDSVARIGGRLGELRLDTELDVSHGIVRYLELIKLAALLQRPSGQAIGDAIGDVNARLLAAATPLQREILETSALDDALVELAPLGAREEHSLDPFLPRKGVGLALSASDIETYRSCPLRYKFARVLRIPTEQTLHQRFGIAVHQVLERFHGGEEETLTRINELLDASWRRAGFGESDAERKLLDVGRAALARYHARLRKQRLRAGLVRALVLVPPRPASPARPRRSRRSRRRRRRRRGRRRVRADRLQDLAPEDRRAAAGRRPALALCDRRARGLEAAVLARRLLLRARRRQGAGAVRRARRGVGHRDGHDRRRRDPRASVRADAVARRLLDLRLPDRLPGRRALGAPPLDGTRRPQRAAAVDVVPRARR